MANPTFKRIKDLSLEKTSVADNDWFVLEDSADSFKTKKVKGQYIGANIYKNDGTLTGNRTITGGGYTLTFNNKTQIKSINDDQSYFPFSILDTTGTDKLFDIDGYGVTTVRGLSGTQGKLRITAVTGLQPIVEWAYGSGSSYQGRIRGGNGLEFYGQNGVNKIMQLTNDSIKIGGTTLPNSNERFVVVSPSASALDTAFVVRNNTDTGNHFLIKGNGTLNASSLPTSSAGLSAGDIWNDGGTLKIV